MWPSLRALCETSASSAVIPFQSVLRDRFDFAHRMLLLSGPTV